MSQRSAPDHGTTDPNTLPAIPEIDVPDALRRKTRPGRVYTDRVFHKAYDYVVAFSYAALDLGVEWSEVNRANAVPGGLRYHLNANNNPRNNRTLVHGLRGGAPYAWVEIGGILFDPGYQRFYDRDAWYEATGAEALAHYTGGQANDLLIEHHSYGPWPVGTTRSE